MCAVIWSAIGMKSACLSSQSTSNVWKQMVRRMFILAMTVIITFTTIDLTLTNTILIILLITLNRQRERTNGEEEVEG